MLNLYLFQSTSKRIVWTCTLGSGEALKCPCVVSKTESRWTVVPCATASERRERNKTKTHWIPVACNGYTVNRHLAARTDRRQHTCTFLTAMRMYMCMRRYSPVNDKHSGTRRYVFGWVEGPDENHNTVRRNGLICYHSSAHHSTLSFQLFMRTECYSLSFRSQG